MGFGDSLWGQFDIVKQNCNTGERRIKAVQQLLKKTQKEEVNYADTLAKGFAAFQVNGGKSLAASVSLLQSKLQEEQTARSRFASQLDEETQKLNVYTKTYLKTSHQLSQKTSRDQSQYDSKLALLNKTKNHYCNCCRNEEQLQEALANPNLEPKKQEHLNQQFEKAKESKSQAQDQYALMVNDHDKVFEEFILACRDTLSQYEQLEKTLCETLESALATYTTQRMELAASFSSCSSSMSDSVKTINVDSDLDSFVEQNSKHLEPGQPPQYEEFQSGTGKAKQRRATKTIMFSKPKLGSKKKKGKSDDAMLSPRGSVGPGSTSEPSLSSGTTRPPSREEESSGSSSQLPPAPPPARSADVEPESSSDESAAVASRAPAPSPPGRSNSAPAPSPAQRNPAPPTPGRTDSAPAPSPAQREAGPPPPGRSGDSTPPPPASSNETSSGPATWKIAVAMYPNDGDGESELKLEEGTILFVISEDSTGWWLGATGSAVGFFPGSYIQYLEEDEQFGYVRAKALQDFTGDYDGDLSLNSGEIVTICGYKDSWYTGERKNGEVGIFPCQYVQLLTDD